uniref:Uncharacterized protein n=1 Tax=Physcomitrium patens TaxID=3218 RepID=A0A2K1IVH4_PHYPA|nr:hypothetical protein PHYPA_025222 [Physcomitrium patens]
MFWQKERLRYGCGILFQCCGTRRRHCGSYSLTWRSFCDTIEHLLL